MDRYKVGTNPLDILLHDFLARYDFQRFFFAFRLQLHTFFLKYFRISILGILAPPQSSVCIRSKDQGYFREWSR